MFINTLLENKEIEKLKTVNNKKETRMKQTIYTY